MHGLLLYQSSGGTVFTDAVQKVSSVMRQFVDLRCWTQKMPSCT